jgi:hypothetical protein
MWRNTMMLPLARLTDNVRQAVAPFISGVNLGDIDVFVQPLPFAHAPAVFVIPLYMPSALMAVAMTIGNDIFIMPDYADFESAAGLALLVHELRHAEQYAADPNFLIRYNEAERATPRDKPWLNPFEFEAYCLEAQAFRAFLQQGMPYGEWTPMGVTLGLC